MSNESTPPPVMRAAVHIGASHASMIIISITNDGGEEMIDFLEKNIPLGRDIFSHGHVLTTTIEQAVKVISGFQEALTELGLKDIPVRAVTTNTLTEASNAEVFLNRLQIAAGWRFEPLDDGEMTRLVFLKTRRRLRDTPSMRKRNTIVAHVGPGNTRLLLFKNGQIVRYHSYRLGTHRTWEQLNSPDLLGEQIIRLIREQISGMIAQLSYDFRDEDVEDLVMIGTEIQMLSPFLSKPDKTKSRYKILEQLLQNIAAATEAQRVKQFALDYQTSGSALPALVINAAIAESFELTSLRVPGSDYERGLLADLAHPTILKEELLKQLFHSAEVIARRYCVDLKHARRVAHLSRQLFEETQSLHKLTEHDALLLNVAAILHEVGNHISPKAHELHSLYIVRHSEIFGLSEADRLIVALITRYHRKSQPETSHRFYQDLDSEDRIRVAKLSALIRVADALERTHSQRVTNLTVEITDSKAHLVLEGILDATAERLALPSKADLFENLFGLSLYIKES
ncbi:MAG: HD domain-containing protein [Akkermansiaceae bacterium]|nr:HD domain-containing protein [Akkermansiaceae bacterium]